MEQIADFVSIGDDEWVGSVAGDRFTVWTRGNAGEVYPNVVLPLTHSSGFEAGQRAMRAAIERSGLTTRKDFAEGSGVAVASGVFGGYAYLNLSFNRVMALRLPGGSIADVDMSFMGAADPPPHVGSKLDRSFLAGLRGIRYVFATLRTDALPQLQEDKHKIDALRESIGDVSEARDEDLRSCLERFGPIFEDLFETHLVVSGQAAICVAVLTKICDDKLADASMALRLLGGLGDIDSAAPSVSLYQLGRVVAADGELTAAFDAGLTGLEGRIAKLSNAAAEDFETRFEGFLNEFGSRGPNEWDIAAETWGTDHSLPLALIDRMRTADTSHDPEFQAARLTRDATLAKESAVSKLRGLNKWLFERSLRSATVCSQGRERAKTTIVAGIHELRLAARELARRTAERSGCDPSDMWFVTVSELDDFLAEPSLFGDIIARRRATYEKLSKLEPPFFFEGEPPPIETWQPRSRATEQTKPGTILTGLAGCSGIARGRARIVTHPGEPGQLGPGDVLVAPLTDPSWTPLFVPAEAVVVDVGAVMSHAVIVSRELGIPCVVSVTDATRSIPDGALIEVDGGAGTVTVISVPDD